MSTKKLLKTILLALSILLTAAKTVDDALDTDDSFTKSHVKTK